MNCQQLHWLFCYSIIVRVLCILHFWLRILHLFYAVLFLLSTKYDNICSIMCMYIIPLVLSCQLCCTCTHISIDMFVVCPLIVSLILSDHLYICTVSWTVVVHTVVVAFFHTHCWSRLSSNGVENISMCCRHFLLERETNSWYWQTHLHLRAQMLIYWHISLSLQICADIDVWSSSQHNTLFLSRKDKVIIFSYDLHFFPASLYRLSWYWSSIATRGIIYS